MEASYQLTQSEYEHVTWRAMKERQGRLLTVIVLIGAGMITLSNYNHAGFLAAIFSAVTSLVFFTIMVLVIKKLVVGNTYKALARSPSWGETTVRVEPDSLLAATHLIKSEIRWEAVTKIAEDTKGFYFHLNALQVVMVPRRVFASEGEAQRFWTLAQEYYEHARKVRAFA